MSTDPLPFHRYAVIQALVQASPKPLGRTALMKLLYFLQEIEGVEVGYDFSLYSYGPFDARVLGDLGMTEQLGGVDEKTVVYSNGYGYEIKPGKTPEFVGAKGNEFVEQHRDALTKVIREFGHFSGAQLELLSTMVFVDQEAEREGRSMSLDELLRRVLAIKPKYTEQQARTLVGDLFERRALRATDPA